MTEFSPENKIYLTYKSRMSAEAKLRQADRWLNNLISWYPFCLIIISLSEITDVYRFYKADFVFVGCSIALFGLSLFVYGERYFEKADQFRNCYLEMQALYDSSLATAVKMKKYSEIRNRYDNQTDDYYDDMVFDAWTRNQELKDSKVVVKITWQRAVVVLARRAFRDGCYIALFLFPVTALLLGHSVDLQASPSAKSSAAVVVDGE